MGSDAVNEEDEGTVTTMMESLYVMAVEADTTREQETTTTTISSKVGLLLKLTNLYSKNHKNARAKKDSAVASVSNANSGVKIRIRWRK